MPLPHLRPRSLTLLRVLAARHHVQRILPHHPSPHELHRAEQISIQLRHFYDRGSQHRRLPRAKRNRSHQHRLLNDQESHHHRREHHWPGVMTTWCPMMSNFRCLCGESLIAPRMLKDRVVAVFAVGAKCPPQASALLPLRMRHAPGIDALLPLPPISVPPAPLHAAAAQDADQRLLLERQRCPTYCQEATLHGNRYEASSQKQRVHLLSDRLRCHLDGAMPPRAEVEALPSRRQ